jgi:hypothetical protein
VAILELARLRGTESSNPLPSSGESRANLSLAGIRLASSRSRSFEKVPIRLLVLGIRHSNLLWTPMTTKGMPAITSIFYMWYMRDGIPQLMVIDKTAGGTVN